MHEHVLAAFLRDESEALRIVEPLHRTTSHLLFSWTGEPVPFTALSQRPRPVHVTGSMDGSWRKKIRQKSLAVSNARGTSPSNRRRRAHRPSSAKSPVLVSD